MAEETKPFPQLTCRHLQMTLAQIARLQPWQQLAEKHSARPPRSLRDFQQQYARILAPRLT
ncbi:MAG: hypothetical protein KA257_12945 [Opitutaceae bacterium]|nr:hypothetical protein [Opitutaceae bacterium]